MNVLLTTRWSITPEIDASITEWVSQHPTLTYIAAGICVLYAITGTYNFIKENILK